MEQNPTPDELKQDFIIILMEQETLSIVMYKNPSPENKFGHSVFIKRQYQVLNFFSEKKKKKIFHSLIKYK